MEMLKWLRVSSVVSVLLLVLAGCGNDTKTDTVTNTGSGAINHSPVITGLTASPTTVSVGGTTALTCLASDADNNPLAYSWEAVGGTFSGFSGSGTTISWTAPATAGSYIVSCKATDGKLETVTQVSIGVQAPVPANNAPVITSLTASPTTVSVGGTTALSCLASDTDNDPLTYIWSANSGTITGTGGVVTWTAPATAGSYIVSCKATDGKVETSTQVSIGVQAPVPVPTNSSPVITSLTASPAEVVTNGTTSFSCIATDADNDQLTYTWSANTGIITGTGGTVSWTAPATVGTATITCKISDGKAEASTQASVKVLAWIVPTQFLSSIPAYGRMNGVVHLGRLYLVWAKLNSWGTAYDSGYLSIFDTNTAGAAVLPELSRSEIFGPNGEPSYPSSMAIDQDGIYLAAAVVNGNDFLTSFNFDATVRWTPRHLPSSLSGIFLKKILVQDSFLYVTGDCWGQADGFINAGKMDVIIVKLYTSGTLIWISQWGTSGYDSGNNIEVKTDGLYVSVYAGDVNTFYPPVPPAYKGKLILKYDFNGTFISVIQ